MDTRKILREIFKIKKERKPLTAEQARNFLVFGNFKTGLEEETDKEVRDIELRIKQACATEQKRLISYVLHDDRLELSEQLEKHFKEVGFISKIYKEDEIKDYHVLVIGW